MEKGCLMLRMPGRLDEGLKGRMNAKNRWRKVALMLGMPGRLDDT